MGVIVVHESRGVTPEHFARVMRDLALVAPVEVDQRLAKVARTRVLPDARSRTRRGKTGQLASSLNVGVGARGPVFKNPLAYANVQYWGGRTWHAQSRVGRSAMPVGKAIAGRPAIYEALQEPMVALAIGRELDDMMRKHLG